MVSVSVFFMRLFRIVPFALDVVCAELSMMLHIVN